MQVRKLIVVVNDDADVRIVIHDRLTMMGYYALLMGTPQRALEVLDGIAADGVIVDLGLPGMNGLALAKLVHARHETLPIIMITGDGYPELATQAMVSGIREVMSKPLDLPNLTKAAQKWFGPPELTLSR